MIEKIALLNKARSFAEYQAILSDLSPTEVGDLWHAGYEDQADYWRTINYQAATIDRLNEFGYLAVALNE